MTAGSEPWSPSLKSMRRHRLQSDLLWGGFFGLLVAVLLWSRLVGLDQSFWHDEVFTVIRYAGEGPEAIFSSSRYVPNNHVLFSLLAWGTTSLLGESEVAYRLWSVLPALGASVWLALWARKRFGALVGAAALLLTTASPLLLVLSREARGYGLLILAMVGLVIQADSALRDPGSRAVWWFSAFGLLGVLTIPVFVLPYLLSAVPLLIHDRLRRRLTVGVVASGLIALLWFAPLLGEIIESSSQQFGRLIPWHGAVTLSVSQLVFPIYRLMLPGTPDVLLTFYRDPLALTFIWHALTWSLLVLGARTLLHTQRTLLLAVLALPPIGTYLILAAGGIWAADRHLSYLSIPLFVLMSLGVGRLVELFSHSFRQAARCLLGGVAIWIAISFYPVVTQVASIPHEATKQAAETIDQRGVETILTNSVRPAGFDYYLDSNLTQMGSSELEEYFCSDETGYAYIDHPFKSEKVDTRCLEAKDAEMIRLNQRGRGDHIDVWLVGVPSE